MVNFSTFTFTLPSKHRKRQNIFQIILPNNIQTPENLLTNSQVPKGIITTSSIPHFLTSTLNQTGPKFLSIKISIVFLNTYIACAIIWFVISRDEMPYILEHQLPDRKTYLISHVVKLMQQFSIIKENSRRRGKIINLLWEITFNSKAQIKPKRKQVHSMKLHTK